MQYCVRRVIGAPAQRSGPELGRQILSTARLFRIGNHERLPRLAGRYVPLGHVVFARRVNCTRRIQLSGFI